MSQTERNQLVRNIAIIAHVDHGKTTLVDAMFRQSGIFREGQEVADRIMDRMDLERERGITIAAKNCAVNWGGVTINIIDTPGHADFGGEVERSLSMADGAVLLVDSSEGPLPQTRFVLRKALEAGLPLIVVINKIDRGDARPDEVVQEVYDLFIELDASDDQLEFPLLYAIGREGRAGLDRNELADDLKPLFEAILARIPGPGGDPEAPLRMLVSDLGYSDFLGRLAVGRIHQGRIATSDRLVCMPEEGAPKPLRVTRLQSYRGLGLVEIESARAGDIVVLSGIEDVHIGDTIANAADPGRLKRLTVDEPTVSMLFTINTSPLAGREGKYVQSRRIRDRLLRETLSNVAIRVEETADADRFMVKGRGEFQMAILVETMRREGFELSVGRPEVILREGPNGETLEPVERVFIDAEEQFLGIITEKLASRKGRMVNLINHGSGRVRATFEVPSRGLIGYRDEFLTDTKGTGLLNAMLAGYEPYRGEFPSRYTGSIVADRSGVAVAYALWNLEPRGRLFVVPNMPVYEGMIIGEHNRDNDIDVNACKEKKLTNVRAAGKDEAVALTSIKPMTLEQALHFIREDELVEVTPQSIRLRKVVLSAAERHMLRGKAIKAKDAK